MEEKNTCTAAAADDSESLSVSAVSHDGGPPNFDNLSDYFNSKGELQLSGMSQFTSYYDKNEGGKGDGDGDGDVSGGAAAGVSSDSTLHNEISIKTRASGDGGDNSAATTTTTDNKHQSAPGTSDHNRPPSTEFSITELVEKQGNNSGAGSSGSGSSGKKGKRKKSQANNTSTATTATEHNKSQPLAQLHSENFQGFVHMLPKGMTPKFNPSSASSPNAALHPHPHPPQAARQLLPQSLPFPSPSNPTVRAPNFRDKSAQSTSTQDKKFGRSLTEAETVAELKKMYEEDREGRELKNSAVKPPASPASVIRNLFSTSTASSAAAAAAANPLSVSMPSFNQMQIPTLNDGLDELMNYYMHKYKVKPLNPMIPGGPGPIMPLPPVIQQPSSNDPKEKRQPLPLPVEEPLCVKSKGFVLGDEESKLLNDSTISRCLPQRQTKNKNLSPLPKSPKSRAINLKELDQLWKDIQDTKAKMDQDIKNRLQQAANVPQLLEASSAAAAAKLKGSPVDSPPGTSKSQKSTPGGGGGKQQLRKSGGKGRSRGGKGKNLKAQPVKPAQAASSTVEPTPTVTTTGGSSSATTTAPPPNEAHVDLRIAQSLHQQPTELHALLDMARLDESDLLEDLLLDEMNDDLEFLEFEEYTNTVNEEGEDPVVAEEREPPVPGQGEETAAEVPAEANAGNGNDDEDDSSTELGEDELNAALENVELREWLRSDPKHVVYYEKYCQEKYKRQYCEKEILDLQKQLLESKEKVAGLGGILQIKTKSGHKYQKLWESLIKKWKEHEQECLTKIERLEKENTELSKTVESQLSKTKEYEVELSKTVGLVEEFKDKMEGMRKQFDQELQEWKLKMGFVQQDLKVVKENLEVEKSEKESVQKTLGQTQDSKLKLEAITQLTKKKLEETENKLEAGKSQLAQLSTDKEQLTQQIQAERENQKVLESQLRAEYKQQLKTQADKLHIYYNEKVRDILKTESEKMLTAESEFVAAHEKELETYQQQSEEQLTNLKHHYENQLSNLKLGYQQQVARLGRECEEKGKLIENVSKQLSSFRRPQVVVNTNRNRLESNNCLTNQTTTNLFVLPSTTMTTAAAAPTSATATATENCYHHRVVPAAAPAPAGGRKKKLVVDQEPLVLTFSSEKPSIMAARAAGSATDNENDVGIGVDDSPLAQLLDSNHSMKESIASLIKAYKEKNVLPLSSSVSSNNNHNN